MIQTSDSFQGNFKLRCREVCKLRFPYVIDLKVQYREELKDFRIRSDTTRWKYGMEVNIGEKKKKQINDNE